MSDIPTLAGLVEEVKDEVQDWIEQNPGEPVELALIHEVAQSAIPSDTSTLFAMVVEDNSLGYLEFEVPAETPADALRIALYEEVATQVQRWLPEPEWEDDDG